METFSPQLLKGKRLLFISKSVFITEEGEIETSTWAALKRLGLSALYMVLESTAENIKWVERLHELGIVDDYNADGLVQDKGETRPVAEVTKGVVNWIDDNQLEVDACMSYGDFMKLIQVSACEELGLSCDSYSSVMAAFLKDETQTMIHESPVTSKYYLESFVVKDDSELVDGLQQLTYPVVMKPVTGSGSVGVQLKHDLESCRQFFCDLKRDMANGGPECEKMSYKQEVVLMKYVEGTTYNVEIAVCNGTLVGGVIQEYGPTALPHFYRTTVSMSTLPREKEQQLLEAAFDCCSVIGLRHGVFDAEFVVKGDETPKLIEVNPRPRGGFKELVKMSYGFDIFVVDALLACGVDLKQASFNQKRQVAAFYVYLDRDADRLKKSFANMASLSDKWGIQWFHPGALTTAEYLEENTFRDASQRPTPCAVIAASDTDNRDMAVSKLSQFLVNCQFFEKETDLPSLFPSAKTAEKQSPCHADATVEVAFGGIPTLSA